MKTIANLYSFGENAYQDPNPQVVHKRCSRNFRNRHPKAIRVGFIADTNEVSDRRCNMCQELIWPKKK